MGPCLRQHQAADPVLLSGGLFAAAAPWWFPAKAGVCGLRLASTEVSAGATRSFIGFFRCSNGSGEARPPGRRRRFPSFSPASPCPCATSSFFRPSPNRLYLTVANDRAAFAGSRRERPPACRLGGKMPRILLFIHPVYRIVNRFREQFPELPGGIIVLAKNY